MSNTYQGIFLGGEDQENFFGLNDNNIAKYEFLMVIIVIEHVLLLIQMFFERFMQRMPDFVIQGTRDKVNILKQYDEDN
jgi:hypothetical protein